MIGERGDRESVLARGRDDVKRFRTAAITMMPNVGRSTFRDAW
jgi:hypothetical protein